jgi:hypothetical protein
MPRLIPLLIVHIVVMLQPAVSQLTAEVVTIPESGGSCPVQEKRDEAFQNITANVRGLVQTLTNTHICGPGDWYPIASLNMSDLSQNCPTVWRDDITNGVRSCRRPQSSTGSCIGTSFSSARVYNKVCGRVIGYQVASTDGFGGGAQHTQSIDSYYVYGVSITHGMPRNHIWTLASGITETGGQFGVELGRNCPCSDPPSHATQPPSFVGENYYCESGNPATAYPTWIRDHLYSGDPLWDGKQCEGQCCSNGKTLPWFTVQLPNPTSDSIEVRICLPEQTSTDYDTDDIALQILDLYVQ